MTDLPGSDDAPVVDDSPLATVDMNRTPLGGDPFNPGPPDPANPNLDGGQVLYHMALGALPQDFHPALQPLAQGYGVAFQPPPAKTPGLLGSLDDIQTAIAAAPASMPDDDEGTDEPDVTPAAADGEGGPSMEDGAAKLSNRDRSYLDRYYDAVAKYAQQYKVNPAFPLGLGIESTFGSAGTYLKTGDAFGMTGGSTAHMTHSSSPEENARQLFDLYGPQMQGVGDDAGAFINAMQGRNAKGQRVPNWQVYNSEKPADWEAMVKSGISRMQRALPLYLPTRTTRAKVGS